MPLTRGSACLTASILLAGCVASKPDPSDASSGEPGLDSGTEDTALPEDTGGVETDPNVWHAPCPRDEREQRMIEVGEVSLNVACRGSGPTVVFLHGFPEWHYSWNAVMDELAEGLGMATVQFSCWLPRSSPFTKKLCVIFSVLGGACWCRASNAAAITASGITISRWPDIMPVTCCSNDARMAFQRW